MLSAKVDIWVLTFYKGYNSSTRKCYFEKFAFEHSRRNEYSTLNPHKLSKVYNDNCSGYCSNVQVQSNYENPYCRMHRRCIPYWYRPLQYDTYCDSGRCRCNILWNIEEEWLNSCTQLSSKEHNYCIRKESWSGGLKKENKQRIFVETIYKKGDYEDYLRYTCSNCSQSSGTIEYEGYIKMYCRNFEFFKSLSIL